MSEMVERVARAIATELGANLDTAFADKTEWINMRGTDAAGRWRDINEPFKSDYLAAARAAIEAMREPTETMERHGQWAVETCTRDDPCETPAKHIWSDMITAALGEGE
jgi:predicted RecB family nuclease